MTSNILLPINFELVSLVPTRQTTCYTTILDIYGSLYICYLIVFMQIYKCILQTLPNPLVRLFNRRLTSHGVKDQASVVYYVNLNRPIVHLTPCLCFFWSFTMRGEGVRALVPCRVFCFCLLFFQGLWKPFPLILLTAGNCLTMTCMNLRLLARLLYLLVASYILVYSN